MATLPSLSLSGALRRLGHHCLTCTTTADDLTDRVWFVRQAPDHPHTAARALVVIDPEDFQLSVHRSRLLLATLNRCVRTEGIRIRERRQSDRGRALHHLTSNLSESAAASYLFYRSEPT